MASTLSPGGSSTTTAAPPGVLCRNASSSSSPIHGPGASGGGVATELGYVYHAHSQSQAIIYVIVILVLYFSALTVLIVRYMRKERNQFRLPSYLHAGSGSGSGMMKKGGRGGRGGVRDQEISHLSTLSTQMNYEREGVSVQTATAALLPGLIIPDNDMDTAV